MTPVRRIRKRVAPLARSSAVRSSAWAMVGQLAGVVSGLANFLILARLLGPAEYGQVAGAWALVLSVGPIMTLGAERLVIRDFTSVGDPRAALGGGLVSTLIGSVTGVVLLVVLHPVLLPQVPLLLLAALAVAEVLAAGVAGILISLSFAVGASRWAGVSTALVSLARLGAVLVFAFTGSDDPVTWALLYAAISTLASALQVLWGCRRFGRPTLSGYRFGRRVREGLPFSAGTTAGIVHTSADKFLLVRFGLDEEAGLYSVAYRLATMVSMPVLAVLQAMAPRSFAAGARGGLVASAAFGRRLLPPLAAYGVFAALVLGLAAAVLPDLLGDDYARSAPLLLLLAPLPLVRVMQSITGDALTGAGRQGTRTSCTTVAALTSVVLNVALIPPLGLTGVLLALLLSQLLLLGLLQRALRRGLRTHPARRPEVPDRGGRAPDLAVEDPKDVTRY